MRHEQNWQHYPISVLFLDVPNLKYETIKTLLPQVLTLLARPALAGGVHVVGPAPTKPA